MKKVDLLVLLTYVALVVCASCLTLLLPLSVTSKPSLLLTLCSYVCLSVVSLAILALRVTCYTTSKQAGSNRLHHLMMMEAVIAAGNQKKTTGFDPSLLESHQPKENHNV